MEEYGGGRPTYTAPTPSVPTGLLHMWLLHTRLHTKYYITNKKITLELVAPISTALTSADRAFFFDDTGPRTRAYQEQKRAISPLDHTI